MPVLDLGLEMGGDPQGQQVHDAGVILLAQRLEGLGDGRADLPDLELGDGAVPLDYLIHTGSLLRSLSVGTGRGTRLEPVQ